MFSSARKTSETLSPSHHLEALADRIGTFELELSQEVDPRRLAGRLRELRLRLVEGANLDDLLAEVYALVCEVARRRLHLWPHRTQLLAAAALHEGYVVDMPNGEGKTLAATMPLTLNTLPLNPAWREKAQAKWGPQAENWDFGVLLDGVSPGRGVHLVTSNEYLAYRDALEMGAVYHALGLRVGLLRDQEAFLYAQNGPSGALVACQRPEAYRADIVYLTLDAVIFDYLSDHMVRPPGEMMQTELNYVIVDEVDVNLIDRARFSWDRAAPVRSFQANIYHNLRRAAEQLHRDVHYTVDERNVYLTLEGVEAVRQLLGGEDIFSAKYPGLANGVLQALKAKEVYRRNREYILEAGQIRLVDEVTHFLLPANRGYSEGLQQALQAKEDLPIASDTQTVASITTQNFFRLYRKLAGMSGTAKEEASELAGVYGARVLEIPSHVAYVAGRPGSRLEMVDGRSQAGVKANYYVEAGDPQRKPVFWGRTDYPDVIYFSNEAQMRAVIAEALRTHLSGRPLLIGATSVENSELISRRLGDRMLRRFAMTRILRAAWFLVRDMEDSALVVNELVFLNTPLERLADEDMKRLAAGLRLEDEPDTDANLEILCYSLGVSFTESVRTQMGEILRQGLAHVVLNARNHSEEARLVRDAGKWGAVTVATNVAGIGVDIKLGGSPPEGAMHTLARLLANYGNLDVARMTLSQRLEMLDSLPASAREAHAEAVNALEAYREQVRSVVDAGGLHVIGAGRNLARRIDNQLRGRAARQGAPGSSIFILSTREDLMQQIGGESATNLVQRLNLDESMPVEYPLISRMIARAQLNAEEDDRRVRRILLAYDRILDARRRLVYDLRDEILRIQAIDEEAEQIVAAFPEIYVRAHLDSKDDPGAMDRLEEDLSGSLPQVFPANYRFPNRDVDFITRTMLNFIEDRYAKGLASLGEHRETPLRYWLVQALDEAWFLFLRQARVIRANVSVLESDESEQIAWYSGEIDALFQNFTGEFFGGFVRLVTGLPDGTLSLDPGSEKAWGLDDVRLDREMSKWRRLVQLLQYLGEDAPAEQASLKALQLSPGNIGVSQLYGKQLEREGRLEALEAVLREALEAAPGSQDTKAWLGRVLVRQGRPEEAQALRNGESPPQEPSEAEP